MGFFSKKQNVDDRRLYLIKPEAYYADGKYQASHFEDLMECFFTYLLKERLFMPQGLKPIIIESVAKIFASYHQYSHPLDPYFNERGGLALSTAMRINRIEGMFKDLCFSFRLVHAQDMTQSAIAMLFAALLSNLNLLSGLLPVYGHGGSLFGMVDYRVSDYLLRENSVMLNEINRVVMCQTLDHKKLNIDTLLGRYLNDVDEDIRKEMEKRKPHIDLNKKNSRERADEYVAMIAAKRAAEQKAKSATPKAKEAVVAPAPAAVTHAQQGQAYRVGDYGAITSKVMVDIVKKAGKIIESGNVNKSPFKVLVDPDAGKTYIRYSLAMSVAEKHKISGAKNLAKAISAYLDSTADILIEDIGKKKMYFVFKASIFSTAINQAKYPACDIKNSFEVIKKEVTPVTW